MIYSLFFILIFYNEKNKISGKKRLISITKPAVNVIHIAPTTGIVDRYVNKFLFMNLFDL